MLKDLNSFSKNIKGKIKFDYSLKNHTWLNIGGNAKIFFVPETLTELKDFLLYIKKENNNFFTIGAGSNLLISENVNNHIFIKLGKNFNKISLTKDNIIIAGSSSLDKNVSNFACENHLSGLEFLSCIPGSIGGAIIMNSGCYGNEISKVLKSIKVIDKNKLEEIEINRLGNYDSRLNGLISDIIPCFLNLLYKIRKHEMLKIYLPDEIKIMETALEKYRNLQIQNMVNNLITSINI